MEQYIKERLWVSTTHIPGSFYEEANTQSKPLQDATERKLNP